jgi:S-methylmethionine-dependent homocysteine/selenocysteine methylase
MSSITTALPSIGTSASWIDELLIAKEQQTLQSRSPLAVLDGGLATELERKGVNLSDDPLWSAKVLIEAPEKILQCHLDYLNAGAQIIETSTYQATFTTLAR